jgi:hypothetical protein
MGKNTITCNQPVEGRYITIQIVSETSSAEILTLCEVQMLSSTIGMAGRFKNVYGYGAARDTIL